MTTFWCTKSCNFWAQNSNGRISASFYRLASFEMYVRGQMWSFQKILKFLDFLVYLNQKFHFGPKCLKMGVLRGSISDIQMPKYSFFWLFLNILFQILKVCFLGYLPHRKYLQPSLTHACAYDRSKMYFFLPFLGKNDQKSHF